MIFIQKKNKRGYKMSSNLSLNIDNMSDIEIKFIRYLEMLEIDKANRKIINFLFEYEYSNYYKNQISRKYYKW